MGLTLRLCVLYGSQIKQINKLILYNRGGVYCAVRTESYERDTFCF